MIFIKIVMTVLTMLIFLYMFYYFILSLMTYIIKPERVKKYKPKNKFLILVPAKNEENVIDIPCKDLLNQHYPKAFYDVYVVADGCSDNTAKIALKNGANVIDDSLLNLLRDRHGIGKSKTLDGGLQVLKDSWNNYDYLIVIDSDNNVSSNFLEELNNWAIQFNKPQAMQAKLLSKENNDKINIVNNGLNTSFKRSAKFQQEVESRFGCASLLGTGFATNMSIIKKLGGFRFKTLVEDEYEELSILLHGGNIKFVNNAYVVNENYSNFKQANKGLRRWGAGSYQCFLLLIIPTLLDFIICPTIKGVHTLSRISTLSKATQIILLWVILLANWSFKYISSSQFILLPHNILFLMLILNIIMTVNIVFVQTFIVLRKEFSFSKTLFITFQTLVFLVYFNVINLFATITFWYSKWSVSSHGKIKEDKAIKKQ